MQPADFQEKLVTKLAPHTENATCLFFASRVKREHYQLLNAGALFDGAIENLVS